MVSTLRINRTTWHKIELACIALLLLLPTTLRADQNCLPVDESVTLQTTLASAGFFANLRNSESSLNYQMDVMLADASDRKAAFASKRPPCSGSCPVARLAVVFNSTPNMRRTDYSDRDVCDRLEKETSKNPIVYRPRIFDSGEEAKEWYHDLTTGDGPDGEDLYERCPGNCSPSYSSTIISDKEKLIIATTIVCGHARDKDDNQYQLSSSLRWICS